MNDKKLDNSTQLQTRINEEQKQIDIIYNRFYELWEEAEKRANELKASREFITMANNVERNALIDHHLDQVAIYRQVKNRLIFGKLTFEDGSTKYIGRIAITDKDKNFLLYDWRSKSSEDFYQATSINPKNIKIRTHIFLQENKIVGLEDELFDYSDKNVSVSGESAILKSLNEGRTNKMNDIVATIQKEQDEIIRSQVDGALVVQGGAGTGKTAVALHRAAYLLYEKKNLLTKSGILLIGPNNKFLYYIDSVLPSLGETGVISKSISNLYYGIEATLTENPIAQRIKGDLKMIEGIKNMIKLYLRVPKEAIQFRHNNIDMSIEPEIIKNNQAKALKLNAPFNDQRKYFIRFMIEDLLEEYKKKINETYAGFVDSNDLAGELKEAKKDFFHIREIIRTLNYSWMQLLPKKVINDLFSSEKIIEICLPWVRTQDVPYLIKSDKENFSKFDIPLIDQADQLITSIETSTTKKYSKVQQEIAQSTVESLFQYGQDNYGDRSFPAIISAEDILSRQEQEYQPTINKLSSQDRNWTFGHVIVDEAQELSPMDWNMLIRKCPSKSFTIVGDVMQTSSPAGTRNWDQRIKEFFQDNYQIKKLTINYRNPKEVAQLAYKVLKKSGSEIEINEAPRKVPKSVEIKSTGVYEVYQDAAHSAYELINQYVEFGQYGKVVVIVRPEKVEELTKAIYQFIEDDYGQIVADQIHSLKAPDAQLEIISPEESKGLEYDAVVLVEPIDLQEFDANNKQTQESKSALYIAMTRPTQKLVVVHFKDLPKGF